MLDTRFCIDAGTAADRKAETVDGRQIEVGEAAQATFPERGAPPIFMLRIIKRLPYRRLGRQNGKLNLLPITGYVHPDGKRGPGKGPVRIAPG